MIKRIVVYPTQGIGNRIKVILSAKVLSKYLNIPIHINWLKEKCINLNYSDIFSDDPNTLEDKIISKSTYIFNPDIHTEKILNQLIKNNVEVNTLVIQGGHCFKHPDMSIYDFLKEKQKAFKNLEWCENILQKVNKLNLEKCIGLHVRKYVKKYDEADNLHSKGFDQFKCGLEYYYDKLDKILPNYKNHKIFCSSNNNNVKQLVKEKYGEKVIQNDNTTFERSNTDDGIESVVDFICLSRCSIIIGTYFSSFSDEACFFNLIPKICISDKEEKDAYHTYGYDDNTGILIPYFKNNKDFLI